MYQKLKNGGINAELSLRDVTKGMHRGEGRTPVTKDDQLDTDAFFGGLFSISRHRTEATEGALPTGVEAVTG